MPSSSSELSRHTNNLDALRFGAAGLVILGHSFVLLGYPVSAPALFGVPIDRLGVDVFFVISGYLITRSWTRRPAWGVYLAARALRIFPGLIVVTLLSMFVLGPLFTTLPAADYLTSGELWRFAKNMVVWPAWSLPGVFSANPYSGVVNGSLWTLPVEFTCYLIVPLVLLLPHRLRVWGAVAFGVACVVLNSTLRVAVPLWGYNLSDAVLPWIYFAAGMIIALAVERRVLRLDAAVFALFVLTIVDAIYPHVGAVLVWIVLPYAVLAVGLASSPFIRRASRFGDVSYGLYIYAFPVQQIVVALLGVHALIWNVGAVVLGTLVLSLLSWRFVEAPALRVKVVVEGRMVARRLRSPAPVDALVSGDVRS